MRLDWNSMKTLKKKRGRIAHAWMLCLLMTTLSLFGRMPAQAAPIIDTTISTGASGVGELWMLGSTTGAQNLSIVIKSPHGKLIVVD